MTLVIYKDHRIEIEYEGKLASFSIVAPNGHEIIEDSSELKKNDLIRDCRMIVDQYISHPERFVNGSENTKS